MTKLFLAAALASSFSVSVFAAGAQIPLCETLVDGSQVVLVRVGVDQSYGGFNAPMDFTSGRFTFVPIPEQGIINPKYQVITDYSQTGLAEDLLMPVKGQLMHLDPDFSYSTYGDRGGKAKQIFKQLKSGDIIVFYASFKDPNKRELQYALIGLNVIDKIMEIGTIPDGLYHMNAHTRRQQDKGRFELVVFGDPKWSGRFELALPIGELRAKAYRVREDLLKEWGGLSTNDGFIQRSGALIFLNSPIKFMHWLNQQGPSIVQNNFGTH